MRVSRTPSRGTFREHHGRDARSTTRGIFSAWWATPYARNSETDLRTIFAAASREQALALASEIAQKWRGSGHEKVAEHLEEHIEECLTCLAFPESHQRRIRTTNGLERLNQEIKKRTRVVRIFPNRESCLRLVRALAVEVSEEWVTGRRYLEMEELREHRGLEELVVDSEESMIMES